MEVHPIYYWLLIASLVSGPLYVVVLIMLLKYRKKFNSSFYKIIISSGFFDILHLLDVWFMERCVRFGWLGVQELVMLAPKVMAKVQSYIWWYTAFGIQ